VGYVDSIYYKDTYKGTQISDAELPLLLVQAEDNIEQLTYFRIGQRGFENLSSFQQRYIQMAICVQAEHLNTYGDMLSASLGGYSVGSVSVSFEGKSDMRYSKQALSYLISTGFMYRGLGRG